MYSTFKEAVESAYKTLPIFPPTDDSMFQVHNTKDGSILTLWLKNVDGASDCYMTLLPSARVILYDDKNAQYYHENSKIVVNPQGMQVFKTDVRREATVFCGSMVMCKLIYIKPGSHTQPTNIGKYAMGIDLTTCDGHVCKNCNYHE